MPYRLQIVSRIEVEDKVASKNHKDLQNERDDWTSKVEEKDHDPEEAHG